VLTGNLAPTGTADAIVIENGVSGIALDLAGFAILGPVVCTRAANETTCSGSAGAGIRSAGSNADVRVHDGSVRGMSTGVLLASVTSARVERIQATGNASIGIQTGAGGTVESSIANLNGVYGITTLDESSVQTSIAAQNGSDGIFVGSGCAVLGNVANGNLLGIRAPGGMLLIGNTVMDNLGNGFVPGGGASTGYGRNVFTSNNGNALGVQTNPEISPGTQLQLGINLCGTDTSCP
jgi:hypothetical protein